MSELGDGGPAFPRPCSEDKFNEETFPSQRGMSLRDWFAAQALAGYLAAYSGPEVRMPVPDIAADRAYEYADAMLKARQA